MPTSPRDFDAITFDCYGTLVDWETGILSALAPLWARSTRRHDDAWLLSRYAVHEAEAQRQFCPYREVLGQVTTAIASDLGVVLAGGERAKLADTLGDWPLFADTAPALASLAERWPLGILSNIDDALFEATRRGLSVQLRWIVTAEQVGSYKPCEDNFHALLDRMQLPAERVLHVAQSRFHDIEPARRLGFTTVWVNRASRHAGSGATLPADATPHFEVPDMAGLCALLEGSGQA
jgi:2-haloacid dehalogenase